MAITWVLCVGIADLASFRIVVRVYRAVVGYLMEAKRPIYAFNYFEQYFEVSVSGHA